MNRIKEFIRLFGSIFCGVDLFILNLCNEDKVDFIKKELGVFFVVAITIYAKSLTNYWFLWGIAVLFIYKLFLSNLNIVVRGKKFYVFIKFLLAFVLSGLLIYLILDFWEYIGIIGFSYISTTEAILMSIVVILVFFACFYPVRFSVNENSLYAKLYNQYVESNQLQAEIKVKKQINELEQNARIQEKINVAVEKEYIKRLSNEIVETRMRIAKLALEKWEKEQKQKIDADIEDYINTLD